MTQLAKRVGGSLAVLMTFTILSYGTGQQQVGPTAQTGSIQIQKNDSGMFNPAQQQLVTYDDADLRLASTTRDNEVYISVQPKNGAVQLVKLPSEIVQVNEIRRVQNEKAVVLGMANGNVYYIALIDLLT